MIRVVAIDDHPLIQEIVTEKLAKCQDMQLVAISDNGRDLLKLVARHSPDVVILDLGMDWGEHKPTSAVTELLQKYPHVKILILTADNSPVYMRGMTQAGVKGYILKSDHLSSLLPEAVRKLHADEHFYSPAVMDVLLSKDAEQVLNAQEIDVLKLVDQGMQNNAIGQQLNVSEKRIRNVLSSIYSKMGIQEDTNPRVAALREARNRGLL